MDINPQCSNPIHVPSALLGTPHTQNERQFTHRQLGKATDFSYTNYNNPTLHSLSSMADLFSAWLSMSLENHSLNSSWESNKVGMIKCNRAHSQKGKEKIMYQQKSSNCGQGNWGSQSLTALSQCKRVTLADHKTWQTLTSAIFSPARYINTIRKQ